jgi:uncharacterized protein (TIGR02265 family)
MFDQPLRPEQPFEGPLDADAIAATFPASYMVKGMFCSRFAELLGGDFERVAPKLSAAPRGGRYVPFKDYPQSDYTHLVIAAARKRFPDRSVREAVRCTARDDLATFAASMFGKIVLALAGDARTTLLRTPDAYKRVAPGPRVRADDLDPTCVRVVFEEHRGIAEYLVGQLEGVVLSFGHRPTVVVRQLAETTLAFDVTHRG